MGICPIVFNMLQFWLIDSIVKAKDALNLNSPTPHAIDETQAPLFSDERRDSDSDEEGTTSRRRRSTSRDLERGDRPISPFTLAEVPPIDEQPESKKWQASSPTKQAATGHAPNIIRRSPPPSPALAGKAGEELKDDDWGGWGDDDPDWEGEAAEPFGGGTSSGRPRSTTRSPKAAARRLSVGLGRSETGERTSVGMDVIHSPETLR
jgi:hypothetical protein